MQNLVGKLGYGAQDRLLILNCDDLGSSHSANLAIDDSIRGGIATSATLMVPCPWAREAVDMCGDLDIGIQTLLIPQVDYTVNLVGLITNVGMPLAVIIMCARLLPPRRKVAARRLAERSVAELEVAA